MTELNRIFKKINENIDKKVTNFVYYDKFGEIKKISNAYTVVDNLECVEVPHETVKNIITGKHKFSDYTVTYNNELKSISVKLKQKKLSEYSTFYNIASKTFGKEEYKFYFENTTRQNLTHKPIYQDIFVDVWYNELEHLPGQHVWHNYNVYKILSYQDKDTVFSISNAEKKLENVKLFADHNESLSFDRNLENNDIFLSYNKLFMYKNKNLSAEDIDVLIVKNLKKQSWQIIVSDHIKKNTQQFHKTDLSRMLSLSVTEYNDPNILYRALNVKLNDLLSSPSIEIPFKYEWEKVDKNVSIFVEKFFDSYLYGIYNG